MEHMELRLDELSLMEARARFRREHEHDLSAMLRSGLNARSAFREYMRELWSSSRREQGDAAGALASE